MYEIEKEVLVCTHCHEEVQAVDEFCPHCGTLFEPEHVCAEHHSVLASGVCIICAQPWCDKCGSWVHDRFLCRPHNDYEIYEGMARVYGTLDDTMAQYVRGRLEEAGLHPFIFSRMQPLHGSRMLANTLVYPMGDYDGHLVYEIKVLVPCQEALEAEQHLREWEFRK
ncbi:zinc-ribbon domain-containing protein [candidate division KSB1 bacterium]|nr:zinc-ribbon domain-containing protein [candidate division KSB1 bacterium]